MSVFFVVAWAVALICFLVIPVVASKEVRQRWYRAVRYCEWTTSSTPAQQRQQQQQAATDDQAQETEQFHYRLSSAQEDEIRESFLIERLKPFTTTLKATDIQLTQEGHQTTIIPGETAASTHSSADVIDLEAQTETENNSNKKNHDYDSSDDCSSDGGSPLVDEFAADYSSHVSVPLPGYSLPAVDSDITSATAAAEAADAASISSVTVAAKQTCSKRQIPNGCAICLCAFEATDRVTWSSNEECKHVFHADCVLNWLKTSGRRHLRRRRRQELRDSSQVLAYAVDPLAKIINFPMVCPCCRQVFLVAEKEDKNNNNSSSKTVIPETVPSTTTTTSEASSSAESVGERSLLNASDEHDMETEGTTPSTILSVPVVVGSDDNV